MNTLPKSLSKENVEVIRELFNWLIQPCLGESSAAHRSTGQLPKPPDHLNHQPPARITHQPLKNPNIQTNRPNIHTTYQPSKPPTTRTNYPENHSLFQPRYSLTPPTKHSSTRKSKPTTPTNTRPINHPNQKPPAQTTQQPLTLPTTLLTYSAHHALKHPKIKANHPNKYNLSTIQTRNYQISQPTSP